MPNLTLRMSDKQHGELTRRARLAGLSLSSYVLQAALAEPTDALLREIHRAVVGSNGNGLSDEGKVALAAIKGAGMAAAEARGLIEKALTAAPKADAAELVRTAYQLKGR